jgi:hypothetical protein
VPSLKPRISCQSAKTLQLNRERHAPVAGPGVRVPDREGTWLWHDRCTQTGGMEAPVDQSTVSAMRIVSPGLVAGASRALWSVPLAHETKLDLLRGMLCRLDDVTSAGQQYLMAKVLPLLRQEAVDQSGRFRPRDLEVVTRSLDELEHEVSRVAPDPSIFGEKAQILVDVLALA